VSACSCCEMPSGTAPCSDTQHSSTYPRCRPVQTAIPGPFTPKRKEPKVAMIALAWSAMASAKPRCRATPFTQSFTIRLSCPSTSSRSATSSWLSYRSWLFRYCGVSASSQHDIKAGHMLLLLHRLVPEACQAHLDKLLRLLDLQGRWRGGTDRLVEELSHWKLLQQLPCAQPISCMAQTVSCHLLWSASIARAVFKCVASIAATSVDNPWTATSHAHRCLLNFCFETCRVWLE
jgi:hypothetical protein